MADVAAIGECMVELSEHADGHITRSFGGDTLNTATYLARLGVATDYVTALGDDPWSDEMIAAWQAEGIGTTRVLRLAGRLPGLYVIQTDARGERRFSYWRDRAPARELFALPDTDRLAASFCDDRWLYVSGISIALYGTAGRERLFRALQVARRSDTRVAFDTNFRARLWADRAEAQNAYDIAMRCAALIFASEEDLEGAYGSVAASPLPTLAHRPEIVLKQRSLSCHIKALAPDLSELDAEVPPEPVASVVDTTAAGDSFAAAYLAARLRGVDPIEAARAGHRLAACVVQHRGAIIPRAAMRA